MYFSVLLKMCVLAPVEGSFVSSITSLGLLGPGEAQHRQFV